MTIKTHFEQALAKVLSSQPTQITVAYSGGLDSHVMLHLLAHFDVPADIPVVVVHVNHGLSGNAGNWQQHSQHQASELGFKFVACEVNVDRGAGSGLEAAARDARYDALFTHTPDDGVILLAQHLDDQLETVLLQLKRGAGPKGLSAMASVTASARGICLVRPLLNVSRAAIEEYAQAFRLDWQEDESNTDTRFDRNFLRHNIIPLLTQRWPDMPAAVKRSAALCAQQNQLVAEACAEKLVTMVDDEGGLIVERLNQSTPQWQAEIIRTWLAQQQASMPSQAVLGEIIAAANSKPDANPEVSWLKWQIKRFKGRLKLVEKVIQPEPLQLDWDGELAVYLEHLGLSLTRCRESSTAEHFPCDLSIRYDGFSERFKPSGAPHSKPLKQWFKEWEIPPWQRSQIAQLYVNGQLIALVMDGALLFGDKSGAFTDLLKLS